MQTVPSAAIKREEPLPEKAPSAGLVGSLFGIAALAAAEGEIATRCVFELPKAPAAVIGVGNRVAWDGTAKQVVLPGVGLCMIGVAVATAGNGTTTVRVRLDGVATEVA
ncbi:MAG: hypothetical protein A3G18_05500 [Rhodospirillales bacterium RIFCSPLOWO2_12_FULL_58_28]|nr:MAG: hypothetical protein A3H92_05635 [Rhodospirillales bacterium RIFCSPLOWO2_02_FULL_58_16]OHC79442.1 MAG: hypothetical protein A3G18_05500 [Rhodospirillales bacterium RIFCSPLOWO2_12_FULL_58_28]